MERQLLLNLLNHDSYDIDSFIVSDCNNIAYDAVNSWPNWSSSIGIIIYGKQGSGKTHLLRLWQNMATADILLPEDLITDKIIQLYENKKNTYIVIDDIDNIISNKEQASALFHLFNIIKTNGGNLLLTASSDISQWKCEVPDLLSRLKTLLAVHIEQPDEELLFQLLVKFFSDRQVKISPDVISYLVKRTERSFVAVLNIVEKLDSEALLQKRPITIPLVRNIIKEIQENS